MLSQWPSSGRWATRMAAVSGPTPGTVRYSAARWARGALLCYASWYSLVQLSNLLIQPSDVALGGLGDANGDALVQPVQFLDSLFHQLPPPP